jgi:hypothetical protein
MNDEFIYNNFSPEYDHFEGVGEVCLGFTNEDLRTAYDLGESKGRADMLEQVIEWLKECPNREGYYHTFYEPDCDSMIRDLKKTIHQQENN